MILLDSSMGFTVAQSITISNEEKSLNTKNNNLDTAQLYSKLLSTKHFAKSLFKVLVFLMKLQ